MTQDSLVADICTAIRFGTETPAQGISTLALAFYMFWKLHKTDDDFPAFIDAIAKDLKSLHASNNVTTGVQ